MTSAFDRAAAVMFGNADMSVAAIYYPGGDFTAGEHIQVCLSRADQSVEFADAKVVGTNTVMSVQCALAPLLAKGCLVKIGLENFRVSSTPIRDAARVVQKCLLTRVAP
jgi:hypothetical protein